LIGRTVMRRPRRLDAVELDQHLRC
jgi:hypothetical protein